MAIIDIHTHTIPTLAGTAVINAPLEKWEFQKGQWYSVGIHPWELSSDWKVQLEILESLAGLPQVVMIGETGIDKAKGPAIEEQISAFTAQVQLSERLKKPLIIHAVHSMQEILYTHKQCHPSQPWLIHGFRGGVEQAKQYDAANIFVSFGIQAKMEVIQSMPLQKLFFETDDRPDTLQELYQKAAQKLQLPEGELKQIVSANCAKLLFS